MYTCPYCAEFRGRSFDKLLTHIKFIHSHEPNFSIACANCVQNFRKFTSFKSHIQREKKKLRENLQVPVQPEENTEADIQDIGQNELLDDEGENVNDVTRYLALFILKTKEENQLNQQPIDAIINSTKDLIESSLTELKTKIKSCFVNSGMDVSDVEGLHDVLEQPSIYSKAKEPLSIGYLQSKYFLENFDLVEPEEIILSQHVEYRVVNGQQKLIHVKDVFHYIPILRTLKALLSQPDILEQVTNPLGSKTKKHKIGAFYFILGNINPVYRSVLNMIQLVTRCKVPLIVKYGMDKTLAPFMKDLNLFELENGVQFNIEGQTRIFRGSIGPYNGDNLGAHSIGGFLESFSSLRICRFCMVTSEDIQEKFTENEYQLRTRESQARHCDLVQNDPSLASAYGVKRDSILNQSQYFHVIGGLNVDVMHDQLEGVLPLEMKMLLKKFVQEDGLFSIEELNERIEKFSYGPADIKNKPSPIKPQQLGNASTSLSQSAAQMWCLPRMFPLIAGDLIPIENDNWENLLKLLKIEEIVFAPKTTVQLAAYLGLLIEEYLDEFGELYARNKIPKQHFMVHYPGQIVRRGPFVRNWTMQFEAKHNVVKRLVDRINNFKNITYSLAKRHQALQAYLQQTSNGHFLRMTLEVGPGKKSTVADENLQDTFNDLNEQILGNSELTSSSWVKVYGTTYSKGAVVITGMHHGNPIFSQISRVMVVDGRLVIFECKTLLIREFVSHLNAYRLTRANETYFIEQRNLQDFHPLGMHKGFGCYPTQFYVVLCYRVDLML